MDTMTMTEAAPSQAATERWSAFLRIAFRFCVVYFGLYCVASQVINSVLQIPTVDVPDWATLWPVRPVVFWVAAHVFGLKTPLVYSGSGSGDKQFDWVLVFCIFVASALAAAVWSILDRRRDSYPTLEKWFRLFLTLCLGSQMFIYGMVKAIPLQMPYPFLSRLVEPFGNMSPMGVLWFSVGASPAYETFAGCAELLGGLLLISRRTRTLGLLICLADMTQVFVLNMTYDVPVKQFSFHLILISLFLLLPQEKRLANFFLLNRAAEPYEPPALFAGRRAQRIASGVVAFVWLWMLGCGAFGTWENWHQYGPGAPKSPLYGIWNVKSYSEDGKDKPLLATSAQAWRRLIFDYTGYLQVQLMDDSQTGLPITLDEQNGILTLNSKTDKSLTGKFSYKRIAPGALSLDGDLRGRKVALQLERMDEKKFLLESRGFHWAQDYPFNR